MCEEKQSSKTTLQLEDDGWNRSTMLYGCCFRQGNVQFFGVFDRFYKMRNEPNERERDFFSVRMWLLLVCNMTEKWWKTCYVVVQRMVHGYVGYGGCKLYFSSHFQATRHGYVMGVSTCTKMTCNMTKIWFLNMFEWPNGKKNDYIKKSTLGQTWI